jgi:hypothetical protein
VKRGKVIVSNGRVALASALLLCLTLSACSMGLGAGADPADGPAQVGQAVGGAVQTIGVVTGNPLLVGLGTLLVDAIPYVVTALGTIFVERKRPFSKKELAKIAATKSEKPVP